MIKIQDIKITPNTNGTLLKELKNRDMQYKKGFICITGCRSNRVIDFSGKIKLTAWDDAVLTRISNRTL